MMVLQRYLYGALGCALLMHAAGCFRPQEAACQSASECFGDESCVDGECVAMIVCASSTSCPPLDLGVSDADEVPDTPDDARTWYGELTPRDIVSSEVAVSMRYGGLFSGACRFALASDGAPWVAFTETENLSVNQVALLRQDPSSKLWQEHLISDPDGFFGLIDLEAAPDGRVALCVHEEFSRRVFVHELDETGDLGKWSVLLSQTEEMQCQVASGSQGQAVLYKERTGDGSRSALMFAQRDAPGQAPSLEKLDAASHDSAWTFDLLADAQGAWVALYHGMLGGRAQIRYGERIESMWSFEVIETAFPNVQRGGAAALGPDGSLHVVTLEDTVLQGDSVMLLTYLHPEDEALDLVLESSYFAPDLIDLAIDPSGRPHLVFSDGDAHWYATLIDGRWRVRAFPEVIDLFPTCLRVQADAQGRAHILMDNSGWSTNQDRLDLVYRVVDMQVEQ